MCLVCCVIRHRFISINIDDINSLFETSFFIWFLYDNKKNRPIVKWDAHITLAHTHTRLHNRILFMPNPHGRNAFFFVCLLNMNIYCCCILFGVKVWLALVSSYIYCYYVRTKSYSVALSLWQTNNNNKKYEYDYGHTLTARVCKSKMRRAHKQIWNHYHNFYEWYIFILISIIHQINKSNNKTKFMYNRIRYIIFWFLYLNFMNMELE